MVVGRPREARYQLFKSIRYQRFLVVSMLSFDSGTSRFKPCSTVLLWHNIVGKMILDSCAKYYLEHSWWFYFDPIPSNILPKNIRIFQLFFFFDWHFLEVFTHMLTMNRAGSVSKTSDTWRKYRYLPPTYKYRQYISILGIDIVPIPRQTLKP